MKLKRYYPYLTGLTVFIIYLLTMAPTVVQIDSGELASVQATLGIAHPTGYPLFTMLGYIFLSLPLPYTEIYTANLLAATWCSAGIVLFIKSSKLILDKTFQSAPNTIFTKDKTGTLIQSTTSENIKIAATILAGLITAFGKTFWLQSTSVEVYSLHILLINLILYTLLKAYFQNDNDSKQWFWVAFMLALGFSNHMTTLLILPGIALLFFNKEKIDIASIKKLALMLLLFFVILVLVYSYLPIRASQNPALNWGNPISFENFFRHFTGKQYQVWIFSSFDAAKKQLLYFVNNMTTEFTIPILIIISTGIVSAFKASRIIFFFFLILFLTTVVYSINYDINDIDPYFLLAYISLGFFSLFGIVSLLHISSSRQIKLHYSSAILILLLGFQFISNYKEVDQSDVYTFEDYTKAVLSSTDDNSIIFSYQWDYFISQSYYFQQVEKFRDDVVVIDKELLRRSWYYNQIGTNHPEVITNMGDDIDNFLNALQPFERSEKFNPNLLEKYFRRIMTNLIATNIESRNYYIGLELVENEWRRGEFSLPPGFNLVPHLLLFKVVKGNEYVPAPDPDFIISFPDKSNDYTDSIKRIVVTMLINRAFYELRFNKPGRAKIYTGKAARDFPDYKLPPKLNHLLTQ